jgi:hypothetical protein
MALKDPFIVVKTPSQSKGGVAETSIKVRKNQNTKVAKVAIVLNIAHIF